MSSELFISQKNKTFFYKQLNSKFYGYLYSVSSVNDIKTFLNINTYQLNQLAFMCPVAMLAFQQLF